MFRPLVVVPLVLLIVACAAACGGSRSDSRPTASMPSSTQGDATPFDSPPTASTRLSTPADDNQIRLTAVQSARLVTWAETFRSCMHAEGMALGPLEKSETQIRMALPPSVDIDELLTKTPACGDRQ